jgi:hypothetical protein
MTVNKAIEALTRLRDEGYGAARLWTTRELVISFDLFDGGDDVHVRDAYSSPREVRVEADARDVLRRYGVNPDVMTREVVYARLEAEAGCGVRAAINAVLGGVEDPDVRMPVGVM